MTRGKDADESPSGIDVPLNHGRLTKANCDAVRDAALACSGNTAGMASYFLGSYSDGWDEDSEYGKSTLSKLSGCIEQFEKVWTPAVADHFIVYRPDPLRRFGATSQAVLTACEYAYWQACTGKQIIRTLKQGPEKTRLIIRSYFGLEDNSSTPFQIMDADIQAEWAAAVRALHLIDQTNSPRINASSVGISSGTKRERKLDAAIDYIRASGPVCGAAIAAHLQIDESTFRKHYVPTLKLRGVLNHGDGYYFPEGAT